MLLMCAVFHFFSCTDRQADRTNTLLDGLAPEMVKHLRSSDDSAFAVYAREVGIEELVCAPTIFFAKLRNLDAEDYEKDLADIFQYARKIAKALETEYHYPSSNADLDFLESLTTEELKEILALRPRMVEIYYHEELTIEKKIEELSRIMNEFDRYGDDIYKAMCKLKVGYIYAQMNDTEDHIRYIREAVADFERLGVHRMSCQALGTLGTHYSALGDIDSMNVCFKRANVLADRSRLPKQAARISSFYAGHYYREGRLALTYEFFHDAMERCRKYKGGSIEVRYIVHAMDFFSDLECWEILSPLLERARFLERQYPNTRHIELYSRRVDLAEARLRMATGRREEAVKIFERIKDPTKKYFQRGDYAKMLYCWARGLLDNGRLDDAHSICCEGYSHSMDSHMSFWAARFALIEARIEFIRGDIGASESALIQFEKLSEGNEHKLQNEWLHHDALRGYIKLKQGEPIVAAIELEKGIERLRSYLSSKDASIHSYLWAVECEELKYLFHDLVADDPGLEYGVELYWSNQYRILGASGNGTLCPSQNTPVKGGEGSSELGMPLKTRILEDVMVLSENAIGRMRDIGSAHCVYLVRDDEIWRWYVDSLSVRRDVLDVSTTYVTELVFKAMRMMSDPAEAEVASVDPVLAEYLRILADVLLPGELLEKMDDAEIGQVFISTDGFLGMIPFETFNVSAGIGYMPLLAYYDVAYLRHAAPMIQGKDDLKGVILTNPEPSEAFRQRYPFQPYLEGAYSEAEAVAELDPGAIFLCDELATKSNLSAHWENASYIYLSTHVLREPGVPYLALILLAADKERSDPESLYLDIKDIRASDLDRCELVVLSGCGSGRPYCETVRAGPSLGDAFLDSGAGSVVQTFWDIDDTYAGEHMVTFFKLWRNRGETPIHALCEMRRSAMRTPDGIRHPFVWAPYSIKVGRI